MRHEMSSLIRLGQENGLLEKSDPGVAATGYIGLIMGVRLFLTDSVESGLWLSLKPLALKILGWKESEEA